MLKSSLCDHSDVVGAGATEATKATDSNNE